MYDIVRKLGVFVSNQYEVYLFKIISEMSDP